jgi:hypothetical protein
MFFPVVLTSTLVSRAVDLMTLSVRQAHVLFRELMEFRQERKPSAATRRSDADLFLTDSARYGRRDGEGVLSITVKMHALARRLVNILLVWAQSPSKVGTKREISDSKETPKPADRAATSSIAEPETLLRSEFIATFSGRESERIPASISEGKLQPPLPQHSVS